MTTEEQIREIINNSPIPKGINATIIANKIYTLHKQKQEQFDVWKIKQGFNTHLNAIDGSIQYVKYMDLKFYTFNEVFSLFEVYNKI